MARKAIGVPHVIFGGLQATASSARKLTPVPLDADYQESWLQRLVQAHPELLPINLIDERIQEPLVPLAMEVPTESGPMDNLMVSANGYPIIVEAKLWRNPEARRKVVAQLLDYAAQVRKWSYEDLEKAWQAGKPEDTNDDSLFSFVNPVDYDSEADWIDLVSENLQLGRFSLLIVGEGIRAEARALGRALSSRPDFQFRLGFVELRLYELGNAEILAIPSCIARTVEIERGIIRFYGSAGSEQPFHVELPTETDASRRRRSSVLDQQAFLDEMKRTGQDGDIAVRVARHLLELLEESDLLLDWQTASVSIKLPDPGGSGTMLSLGNLYQNSTLGCWFSCLEPQLHRVFNDPNRAIEILESHESRGRTLGLKGKKDLKVSLKEIEGRENLVLQWLEDTIELIRGDSGWERRNLSE